VSEAIWRAVGGRFQYRVRETYVRDHLVPLINLSATGAAKVDLILRGVERVDPEGMICGELSWEDLHDLVREPDFYGSDRKLKRNWVGDKLAVLEERGLVERLKRPGGRPQLRLLDDRDPRRTYVEPTGHTADSYVTILGWSIAYGRFAKWGGPQVSAYLAAMIAERYTRAASDLAMVLGLESRAIGGGIWYRPLDWFSDDAGHRPADHIRIPFSERTLRRGFKLLESDGLVRKSRIQTDPRTGAAFKGGSRFIYMNGFDDFRPDRRPLPDPAAAIRQVALSRILGPH
jgi:hypothetical protein